MAANEVSAFVCAWAVSGEPNSSETTGSVAEASPHFIKALLLTFNVEPMFLRSFMKGDQSNRNFRFRSLARTSYAPPALDTTNLAQEQHPTGIVRFRRPSPENGIIVNWKSTVLKRREA